MSHSEERIRDLEAAIKLALGRDGCRCDTSVCGWCETGGWIKVSPVIVEVMRAAISKPFGVDGK